MAYDDSPLPRRSDAYHTSSHRARHTSGEAAYPEEPTGSTRYADPTDPVHGQGQSAPEFGGEEPTGYPGRRSRLSGLSAYRQPAAEGTSTMPVAAASTADPSGEPEPAEDAVEAPPEPRDRLLVHWAWEFVLLVGVAALAYLLWSAEPDALRGESLSTLLVFAASFGLLGLGASASLRAAVPNLAIGPVAAAAMVYFAQEGADGVIPPTLVATGAALVLGLAVAVVVILFQVPGWAASLGAAVAVLVWIQLQPAQVELSGAYDPTSQATFLFLAVAAMGMLGGLLGTLPPVRRAVGRFRPSGDPADRRKIGASLAAGAAIVGSMVLAVPAGVLLAAVLDRPVVAGSGLELTVLGLAVALVGGASVFGRRGGIFGGTLAVVALVLFHEYQRVQGWQISLLATAAVALVIGLGVSRLIETFGRPRRSAVEAAGLAPVAERSSRFRYLDPEANRPAAAESAPTGWATGPESWSSALPAQPVQNQPDPWHDDRWPSR